MSSNQTENITQFFQHLDSLKNLFLNIANDATKDVNNIMNNMENIMTNITKDINKNINKDINKPKIILYRNFIINDNIEENKKKVDSFYEKNIILSSLPPSKDSMTERYKDYPIEKLFSVMNNLLDNKELYNLCENNISYINIQNSFESSIIEFTKNIFILMISNLLKNIKGEHEEKVKCADLLYFNLVKFNTILKKSLFTDIFKKFKITLKHKCIEFSSNNGLISSWLTFAEFCPEMITPDCYPWLNYNANEFKLNDMEFIKTNFPSYQTYETYFDKNKHLNFEDTYRHYDHDYRHYENNENYENYENNENYENDHHNYIENIENIENID
jgi:hypothetical protein